MPCSVGRGTPKFPTTKITLQDVTENGNTTSLSIESSAYFLGDGSLLEGVAKDADLSSNSARISILENNVIISNSSGITTGFTQGDIIYASADNTLEKLNIGNTDQFLKVSSGIPEWSDIILQNVTDDGSNVTLVGNVEALAFYGDGSNLTGIPTDERLSNIEENVIVSNSSGITSGFTRGDLIYASADNTLNKLSLGTNGKVLKSDGTDVYWGDDLASGEVDVGTFQQVTDTGNTTTNTIQFNNITTSLVTAGNVFIEGTLSFPDSSGGGLIDLTAPGYTFGTPLLSNIPDGKFFVSVNGYLGSSGGIEYVAATSNIVTTGNIEALSFFGDGSNLTGVALSSDMTSNASRITILETDISSNTNRINDLETTTIISNSSGITTGFTRGDLIYASADNTLNKLSLGTNDKVLKSDGTDVYWGDVGTLQQVTDTGNTTSNTIQFTNPTKGVVATGNIEALGFYGDGTTLTGVALSSDLEDNSSRITNLEPIKSNTSTLYVSGDNTGISNTNPQHTLAIGSNIHFDDTGTDKLFIQGDVQSVGIIKTFRLNTTTLFVKNQIVVTERPKNTQNI